MTPTSGMTENRTNQKRQEVTFLNEGNPVVTWHLSTLLARSVQIGGFSPFQSLFTFDEPQGAMLTSDHHSFRVPNFTVGRPGPDVFEVAPVLEHFLQVSLPTYKKEPVELDEENWRKKSETFTKIKRTNRRKNRKYLERNLRNQEQSDTRPRMWGAIWEFNS